MSVNIFWFRRDLRLEDNTGLYHALKSGKPVIPVFIFDRNILDKLDDRTDARVTFIHNVLTDMKKKLNLLGSDLKIHFGYPEVVWKDLIRTYAPDEVFVNHDFESYAIERDESVKRMLQDINISFNSFKDHVIFEKNEVVKDDGKPYTVFTPYKRKWLQRLTEDTSVSVESLYLKSYCCQDYYDNFCKFKDIMPLLSMQEIGFERSTIQAPPESVTSSLIKDYHNQRNYPAINGTSRLGVHFRFGTISIREKARKAVRLNETYLSELIWRDFYNMILYHFPHVERSAFRKEYDTIQWRNDEKEFDAWCAGKTGYPIVDAGMRELSATGYMHNRVRMITASFLTKHLLIDWRWGEAWFAKKLLDFDLASNNGGWQWAAGCGTDAAPYFRIFSPDAQTEKFDKERKYIKKWVPEVDSPDYPSPIVDHKFARQRCLAVYKDALDKG